MGPTKPTFNRPTAPWGYKTASSYVWGTDNNSTGPTISPNTSLLSWDHSSLSSATTDWQSWFSQPTGTTASSADNKIYWGSFDIGVDANTAPYSITIISGPSCFEVDPRMMKKMERERRRLALLPSAKATRFGLPQTEDLAELKARQLLKSFIGAERFRRYLKDGFISITSPVTGLVYQIFPGHKSVVVRDKGKKTASCCIVFKDHSLPPTDWVIMRMSLIMADEHTFYQKANVSGSIPERIRAAA